MPDLPFPLWWMADAAVWEWLRPLLAALAGAVVGGLFTWAGQRRSDDLQQARESTSRAQKISDDRRIAAASDARTLHRDFVDLLTVIDSADVPLGHVVGVQGWYADWKTIWTIERRTRLRASIDLIPDDRIRAHVVLVVHYLGNARDHSWEGGWPNAPERRLHRVVGLLAAEAAEAMAAYLRGDAHVTRRGAFLKNLEAEERDYASWEADEVAWQEENAARQYAEASEEERAAMDASVDRLFGRPRGSTPDDGNPPN